MLFFSAFVFLKIILEVKVVIILNALDLEISNFSIISFKVKPKGCCVILK